MQIIKKQRITDRKLVSLVETMNKTFSFAKNLGDLPDKMNTLAEIIEKVLEQTAECAFFICNYARRRFLSTFITGKAVSIDY